jgi:hypothetical protein
MFMEHLGFRSQDRAEACSNISFAALQAESGFDPNARRHQPSQSPPFIE